MLFWFLTCVFWSCECWCSETAVRFVPGSQVSTAAHTLQKKSRSSKFSGLSSEEQLLHELHENTFGYHNFYFITFTCLYGSVILTRYHRLRKVRSLIKPLCKNIGVIREAWVCLATRSDETRPEMLSSLPLKNPANRKMLKMALHLAIRDRWFEEPVSC